MTPKDKWNEFNDVHATIGDVLYSAEKGNIEARLALLLFKKVSNEEAVQKLKGERAEIEAVYKEKLAELNKQISKRTDEAEKYGALIKEVKQ